MITRPSVVLEARDARRWLAAIVARAGGYTPEWSAPKGSAGMALAGVCARYLEAVAQRVNQAPTKHKLAFLDVAGLRLAPAQSAWAPVVFTLSEQSTGGSAPARTPVASPPPPGGTQQIVFETERAVGVTAGKIKQVVSLWPGRDEYIDHSEAFLKGEPVRAFAADLRRTTPHHLYLAHSVLLALAGNVELAVEFELKHPASTSLTVLWEYWDGQVWRGFLSASPACGDNPEDSDSTIGLTHSGHYLLRGQCSPAGKIRINGAENYWLRGRLTQPQPPDPQRSLPEVDGIRISSTVNQALRGRIHVSEPQKGDGASNTITVTVSNEAGNPVRGAVVRLIDSGNPSSRLTSEQTEEPGTYTIQVPSFDRDYLYEVEVGGVSFSGPPETLRPMERPSASKPRVKLSVAVEGLKPDKAFADGAPLDVTKPFFPLGQQPQPGSTFYLTSEEAFSKPGAKVSVFLARTRSPQDEARPQPAAGSAEVAAAGAVARSQDDPKELDHEVRWEYWNGRQWAALAATSNLSKSRLDLNETEIVGFTVPDDVVPVKVNGQEARWVRVRLQSGSYGFSHEVGFKTGGRDSSFKYVVMQPPVVASLRLGYTWQYGPFRPEQVVSYNDFAYTDRTEETAWPGATFFPFERVSDATPALYLGFDKKPPVDQLGLFFDIKEGSEVAGPEVVWEYWNGSGWIRMTADDQTGALRRPGISGLLAEPDDTVLSRFGVALHWLRVRLKEDGPPGEPEITGIFPNAVWAAEQRTLRDLPVGATNGTPNQTLSIQQTPVLAGERIEVRELNGARAGVEWRILAMELFDGDDAVVEHIESLLAEEGAQAEVSYGRLRLVRSRKKQVSEAWVLWERRDQLSLSGARDRHYALDAASGRLSFGDGANGLVPPAGSAVLVREMTTGGGSGGNVGVRTITQLLGVVPGIESVFNPRAAEGGADGESPSAVLDRGPRSIRHRGRAVDAGDYETLAREASPAVAVARAIPGRSPSGVQRAGWITVLIIPSSKDERPYPSFGLRERVREFLEQRAPAEVAAFHRIHVTGPTYLPVDVTATIAPSNPSRAGDAEKSARAALERFLHPLVGGPGGEGWDLGRDVFLSDVAAELERAEGVDSVHDLELLLDGVPQGESLPVGDHEVVAAGSITIRLRKAD